MKICKRGGLFYREGGLFYKEGYLKPRLNKLPKKAVFPYSGNVFLNECFIPGGGNGFSGYYKPDI